MCACTGVRVHGCACTRVCVSSFPHAWCVCTGVRTNLVLEQLFPSSQPRLLRLLEGLRVRVRVRVRVRFRFRVRVKVRFRVRDRVRDF